MAEDGEEKSQVEEIVALPEETAKSKELTPGQEQFLRSIMKGQLPKLQSSNEQNARDEAVLAQAIENYGADIANIPEVRVGPGLMSAILQAYSFAAPEQRVGYILELAQKGQVKVSPRTRDLLPQVLLAYGIIRTCHKKVMDNQTPADSTETRPANVQENFVFALRDVLADSGETRLDPITVLDIAADVFEDLPDDEWQDWDEESKNKIRQALREFVLESRPTRVAITESDDGPEISLV